jgi:hypothetical protein
MPGVAGAIIIPTLIVRRTAGGRVSGWWARRLRGGLGEFLFRVASLGMRRRVEPLPAIGEPTAVALRDAVIQLYDALGADQRAAFPQLPALATRLQRSSAEPKARVLASGTTEDRTHTEIFALEMLRLQLLRLHAAAAEPIGLTRELSDAIRLGDRLAAPSAESVAESTPS